MKTVKQLSEKQYPYLAIFTMGEPLNDDWKTEDIVVISTLVTDGKDVIYVSSLNGSNVGYPTQKESDYKPLPSGTKITITQ